MDSTSPDSVQIPCESVQRYHLPHIYDNARFLASCNSSKINFMTGNTNTSSHTHQYKFDTDEISIGMDTRCSVTMSYFKQGFVGPLKRGWRVINVYEGPKVHTIYEGTIDWNINNDSGHPHRVEIPNYLYATK